MTLSQAVRGSPAPFISVIVSTYNRQDALIAVLNGLGAQRERNFEIVVADDGSEPDASAVCKRFGAKYVWHRHDGFRVGTIRNRAVEASTGPYVIFLDGDCVPMPAFIARHHALAETGWFVTGNRALLSEEATGRFLKSGGHVPGGWLISRLRGDINRISPLFKLPIPRKLTPMSWQGAQSCNLGIWRSDFDRVGGFDETYRGWGYEDSDLVIRLLRAGVKRKDGRFATGVVHLWHAPYDRTQETRNFERLMGTLRSPA